jgi:hypothetical protein
LKSDTVPLSQLGSITPRASTVCNRADPPRPRLQDAEDGLRHDQGLRGDARTAKGQADAFNITRHICGEARIVERAFGLGTSVLAEAVQFVSERLEPKPA